MRDEREVLKQMLTEMNRVKITPSERVEEEKREGGLEV